MAIILKICCIFRVESSKLRALRAKNGLTCKRASRTNAPKRMISFRRARKIRSYLVRTNLYPEESSFKCGSKRCEVCLNANETSTFTSTVTGETYIINPKFNCND